MTPEHNGRGPARSGHARQRGVATLLVTLVILVILTIIILASSNVALFEQKTATNENRQQLAAQAAEYALNLSGEHFKANITKVSTNATNGWFDTAASPSTVHWTLCPSTPVAGHPCLAEENLTRRAKLYYYTTDGAAENSDATSARLDVPYNNLLPSGTGTPQLTTAAGGVFTATVKVRALLCLLNTPPTGSPGCETFANRTHGQRIAVTFVAEATLPGENASTVVKETWASYIDSLAFSSVPLVASGMVQGLGNAMIVAAPNAGGVGLPGTIWAPQDVDIDSSGAGVGSVSTCHLGDYIGGVPEATYKTTCAANSDPCKCTVSATSTDFLSGHTNSVKREDIDVLDVDHADGFTPPTSQPLPDIAFFPGAHCNASVSRTLWDITNASICAPYDGNGTNAPVSSTDDTLFEWIFNRDVKPSVNTAKTAAMDAAEVGHLNDFNATVVGDCSSMNSASEGVYYVTGTCDLPNAVVGSPEKPVLIVANDNMSVNGSTVVYGMIFVRDTVASACTGGGFGTPAPGACLKGTGGKFFGAIVVEGDVSIAGSPQIVYTDLSSGKPTDPPPVSTRFGKLPGSWLDERIGF